MPLAFLLDEHLRGPFWQAILRHNLRGVDLIDAVRVGDHVDIPLGSDDPVILRWAESASRLLVTEDRQTMSRHLSAHLASGRHSPGILMMRSGVSARELLETLLLISYAARPGELADIITFIP